MFPIEEWSGIFLFLAIPTTIQFIFGKNSSVVKEPEVTPSLPEPSQNQGADGALNGPIETWSQAFSVHLTPQELRICQSLLSGKSHSDIAEALYISPNTLKTHLRNIYRKAQVKNRFQLVTLISQAIPRSFHSSGL